MKKRYFSRLFVILSVVLLTLSLTGCGTDLFSLGGLFNRVDRSEADYAYNEDVRTEHIIINEHRDPDHSHLVTSDGTIVFNAVQGDDGILQEGEFAIPAEPDGTLKIPYSYEIIYGEDGTLILYVEGLSDLLPEEFGNKPVDDGGYKLPNGDSIDPDSVTELEDGTVYIDYDVSHRFGSETYCLADGTYASVSYEDEYGSACDPEAAAKACVYYILWDNDTDYYNDLIQKRERYRLSDKFLLESITYSHAENAEGIMIEVSADGIAYDEYEEAYFRRGYTFDPRYGYCFATQEIFYEDETGDNISFIWEYEYNDSWGTAANRTINADGVVTWEVLYDENTTIIQTTERRPDEGFTRVTEFENGKEKIGYQYFENCEYYADGTTHIFYYEEDGTYAYMEEYDPDGILTSKTFYDDEYNATDVIYYDKDGNELNG